MPKSLLINIPEPCHENWHNMTLQEQGRFCGSCQKVVVDFSAMTDKEVLEYFSKSSRQVCGRFSNDQLNRKFAIGPPKKRITLMYVWNVLLASLLMTKSYAQGKPQLKKTVKTTIVEERSNIRIPHPVEAAIPLTLKGTVLNAKNHLPVIGASVYIKGTQNGMMTDSSGNFLLKVQQKDSLELEVSAIGYETQTILMDTTTNRESMCILLKPALTELQTATVIAYAGSQRCFRMGGGAISYKITRTEKIDRFISGLKKDVKVYPNPATRGNGIQVKLSLPEAGDYKLELLSTAGQVMLVQPLFMQTKEQQITFNTETKWSAGIYWIRIYSPQNKNVYQAKVLLQ